MSAPFYETDKKSTINKLYQIWHNLKRRCDSIKQNN